MKQYKLNGHIFSSIHKRLDFDPYVCYEGEIEIKLDKAELIALDATPIEEKEEATDWVDVICQDCRKIWRVDGVKDDVTVTMRYMDKPEPPHEHKWLHNKWRTDYLTHCALDMLCNPHEFEPKLDTRFKYHVCQKCGIVISDAEKKAEFYQCKSYYDDNNQLQDCTCGKCGKSKKIEPIDVAVGNFKTEDSWENKPKIRKLDINDLEDFAPKTKMAFVFFKINEIIDRLEE